MTEYTDDIRRFAADDRRVGSLAEADGTGEVGLNAETVGRRLAVRFALRVEHGRVATIRFQAFGCGFTIAACAAAAELADGHTLTEIRAIRPEWIDAVLGGLPDERRYCAELAVEALHAAVAGVLSGGAVQTNLNPLRQEDQEPRLCAEDPTYRALIDSPVPVEVTQEDRHLFACLLTVAAEETDRIADALGLSPDDIAAILDTWFPAFDPARLTRLPPAQNVTPEINEEVSAILRSHLPEDQSGNTPPASRWLARALAARAAHPGHLWVAMGLFKRPELTAAIRRHLPSLAAANNKGMRWKRYLFKEVCDYNGGMMCKSPNCGTCSDYALCFGPD